MRITLYILVTILMISCANSSSTAEPASYEEIPWVSLSEVEGLVKKKPKKILVDVYTPWCGPCKMMDRNTFTDSEIINQVGKNFYAVKFNAEGPDNVKFQGKEYGNPNYDPARSRTRNARHQLSSFFNVGGYPCLVILDENMRIVDKILGYKTPTQLGPELAKHQKLSMLTE